MSKIKNTNQTVTKKYYDNFTNIFGEKNDNIPETGTYVVNLKTGKLIKVDKNIPRHVKEEMESITPNVGKVKSVKVASKI